MIPNILIERRKDILAGRFNAMASPCEILIETPDIEGGSRLINRAVDEVQRIEGKFSRYKDDNIIFQINNSHDKPITVDEETAGLLDFSARCFDMSDGLFDVTSGVLGRVWKFDGRHDLPVQNEIDKLLSLIGWQKLKWEDPQLSMPANMQIDFGGLAKEYAVDKVIKLLAGHTGSPLLVNLGGDLHVSGPRCLQKPWLTGIEKPAQPGQSSHLLKLYQGALATSGDVFRYIDHDGKRYGHVINPKTGWPERNAPRSVTVAAENCTEAGILATLAMLHGRDAEDFLRSQQVKFWVHR